MKTVKNSHLEKGGIKSDIHPAEMPLESWTDALNVRFKNRSAITRDADIETMKTPEEVPLNLKEVEGVWYWGGEQSLWEYDGQGSGHVDKTRLQYPQEEAWLGDYTTETILNGVVYRTDGTATLYVGWNTLVATFAEEGEIFLGDLSPDVTFTSTGFDTETNSITGSVVATDENEFRENFAYPAVWVDDGTDDDEDPETPPIYLEYSCREKTESFTKGIDYQNKVATFENGGKYEDLVGDTILLGSVFDDLNNASKDLTMTLTEYVDTDTDTPVASRNKFKFSTNAVNEEELRKAFEAPTVFGGLEDQELPPVGSPYALSTYWEFTPFGSTVVASNEFNTPQIRTANAGGLTDAFYDLPNWGVENIENDMSQPPLDWRCKVVRSYGQFLIAINMVNEEANSNVGHAGGSYPQRIRWSSTALPDQAPASWNGASLQTNAGWIDLSGITGSLIDGAIYKESMLLFTENECVEMKFIGGDQIFSFRKLFDDGGMLARNCAIEFKGKQFVVGPNDVYVHDTSSKTSVATDAVQDRLFGEIGQTNTENVRLFHNEIDSEIWILYSGVTIEEQAGVGYFPLNRAAVWNYQHDTWTFFTLPNVSGIDLGISPPLDVDSFTHWDADELAPIPWDAVPTPWSGQSSGFGNLSIVASSYDQKFFLIDYAPSVDRLQHVPRYLERFGIDLSSYVNTEQVDRWVHLNRILPIVTTHNEARMRVLVSGSETQHKAPEFYDVRGEVLDDVDEYIFEPENDYKVDCRQSWSYIAVRIEFLDPEPYQVHQWNYEVVERGRR